MQNCNLQYSLEKTLDGVQGDFMSLAAEALRIMHWQQRNLPAASSFLTQKKFNNIARELHHD